MEDARAYSTWARLEREFALGEERGRGRLLLPRHSRARFLEFVEWMVRDAVRRSLLPVVMHATGVYVHQTRLADFGSDEGIQVAVSRLTA